MTNKEAIKYLQQLYPNGGHCWLDKQRIEAIGMAINALQEEPVSEDLANAAIEYCGRHKGLDARVRAAFVVGANWQKEQIMKNDFSMEVFYETEWDDIHKFLRKNLNGEKVKLVIIKE